MAKETTLTRYRGDFTSITKATELISATAKVGDFASINGKIYEWNATTSTLTESTSTGHYKGTFPNNYKVQQCYPNGGVEGDYVVILGFAHYWNADRNTWVVNEKRDEYIDEIITTLTEQVGKIDQFQTTINNLVAAGYMFGGIIDTATVAPTMNTTKVCFLALTAGTYKNFGDKTVAKDEVGLFKWDGKSWDLEDTGLAKKSTVDALSKSLTDYKTDVNNTIDTFKKDTDKKLETFQGNVNDQISEITNPLVGVLNSPTGIIECNSAEYGVVTASVQRKDGTAVDDPDTFSVTFDGTEVITEPKSAYKVDYAMAGSHAFRLKATKGNMNVDISKSYTVVNPSYLGFVDTDDAGNITDITTLNTKAVFASPSGSYTLTNDADGKYLWIVIPSGQTINSVKTGGYEVPMLLPTAKDGYKYYRSNYPIESGTYTFVIS